MSCTAVVAVGATFGSAGPSHAASSSSLVRAAQRGARVAGTPTSSAAVSREPCMFEGTLLIAPQDGGHSGQWQPLTVRHHRDGTITFAAKAADERAGEELVLDADWRQPFVVAPWRSLPDAEVSGGGRLHVCPFTLTYTPLMPAGGGEESRDGAAARRRTVTLAATSEPLRAKWLASFQEKTQAPHFRQPPPSQQRLPPPSSGGLPRPRSGVRRSAGCLSSLGEVHAGIPRSLSTSALLGSDPAAPRLVTGRSDIWARRTPHTIVRDLYDSYAADPIGVSGVQQKSGDAVGVCKGKRSRFLQRYVERQAQIEGMLQQHCQRGASGDVGAGGEGTACSRASPPSSPPALIPLAVSMATEPSDDSVTTLAAQEVGADGRALVPSTQGASSGRFRLAAWTPNVRVLSGGRDVTAEKWSGGMLFAPPNRHRFRLSVCLLESPAEQPIFFGVAPVDCDLAKVNVFNGDDCGVFMGMGGMRSEDYITALGALGGPVFMHAFGRRSLAQLPTPLVGETVTVLYWEDEEGKPGQVRFSIKCESRIVDDLHKSSITLPMNHRRVRPGDWRPCLLLCVPGTRVRIEELA